MSFWTGTAQIFLVFCRASGTAPAIYPGVLAEENTEIRRGLVRFVKPGNRQDALRVRSQRRARKRSFPLERRWADPWPGACAARAGAACQARMTTTYSMKRNFTPLDVGQTINLPIQTGHSETSSRPPGSRPPDAPHRPPLPKRESRSRD